MLNAGELTFQGEDPNEHVLLVLHQHPWRFMPTGLGIVFLLLGVTAVFLLAQASRSTSYALFLGIPLSLYFGARAWFLWSNTVYVLTNERIIAVYQTGWFQRTVRELQLDAIMTISHKIGGAAATMLNFGDIAIVASGASESDLTLEMVYDPYEVQQRIIRAKRGEGIGAAPQG